MFAHSIDLYHHQVELRDSLLALRRPMTRRINDTSNLSWRRRADGRVKAFDVAVSQGVTLPTVL